MTEITLPNNWRPRDYQMAAWKQLEQGCKRALLRWHRRSGKDDLALHWTAVSAAQRVGVYWHMLPEASQARKAIWDAVNPHTGMRRIDEAFPRELREITREQEMMIRFVNGSTWQVVGSDNFNSLVGSPPVGVVFSEWALAKPQSWAYLRPILEENGGWAMFISTPRGRNHMQAMEAANEDNQRWYIQALPATETGVFTDRQLNEELESYKREYGADDGISLYRQEYLVSYDAAIIGAYWARAIEEAEEAGRVTDVPPLNAEFHTAWDLGMNDSTSIWVFQLEPGAIRVLDYYENNSMPLSHYTEWLDKRGYYGTDWLPHDAKVPEMGTGRTRVETLKQLGRNPKLIPNHTISDGINAARQTIPRCWFDKTRCEDGIEALRQYRRKWDQDRKIFLNTPLHDWASHPADAFRYLSMAWREIAPPVEPEDPFIEMMRPPTFNELWAQSKPKRKRL